MEIVDFIYVRECLRMASSDWYSLPKWIVEAYDKGRMIFFCDSIYYRVGDVEKMAFPVQYLAIREDGIISTEEKIHFLKIR